MPDYAEQSRVEMENWRRRSARSRSGSPLLRAIGTIFVVALIIAWVEEANASGGLAHGKYPINLSMTTDIGQFWLTTLEVEQVSKDVDLRGIYQNTTDQTVTIRCQDITGGIISFPDGTSASGKDWTCNGYQWVVYRVNPGQTLNQLLSIPANNGFNPGASVHLLWDGRQWDFSIPSTPTDS